MPIFQQPHHVLSPFIYFNFQALSRDIVVNMGFDEEQSAQRTMSVPDNNLASEDDAADLGETFLATKMYGLANDICSQAWLQAGVAP